MYHAETWRQKIVLYISVMWPIMVTQLSLLAMNFIDTIMSGRVSTQDLAGVAIGSSLWMPVFTFTIGILLAVTPIVAQLTGSGEVNKISPAVNQAIYLSMVLGIVVILIGVVALDPILIFMDLETEVQRIAFHYLIGLSIGIIPLFVSNVLRNFFDGQGFTRITMLITVLAVPFNILFNYALIFGHFGMPALGGIGAGYATGVTYWVILLFSILVAVGLPKVRHYRIFATWDKPSWKAWKEQLAIGFPIGLSIFFEATIFSVVTLLIGMMYSTATIAANQIALSFVSLIFMIPLSISMALTIVVGYSIGGKKLHSAKQYSLIGVIGALGIAIFNAAILILFREPIASLYTNDPEVIVLAGQFFMIAVIFQLSDAAQASLQGTLRGYKDVTIPFYIAFVAYWIIGIPTAYLLAAYTPLGPFGFWVGITIGLSFAAAGFLTRLRFIQRKIEKGLLPE
ncbi:MATE family efflux transporter [Desulfuribacillus stibiiarsenatis]|uniref:Probable multidrug resistance protein NorM n=1 Tax=Desulfuribacillus stibiiarsenatis TaxID=1390249 RepID=A0A1E5L3U5_9FIRM|nr:MATE family efflux transporter [Desulfuribacillus stibiiarsenatis]OEH84693.1 MATE family efflux transporter [Desulfuribacillus stibiiarsenatis]